jgi:capsular polysaccharide biosynthesis protein
MELKEYLQIFKKNSKLFFAVIFFVILAVFIFFLSQDVFYNTSLTLNISRQGIQDTQDYRFDHFYRLQADEKFSETVVEWLKSPRIVADIYSGSGLNIQNLNSKKLSGLISAEKRSSQMVAVNFSAPNPDIAQKISAGIFEVISQNIQNLNEAQKEGDWFKIIAGKPVIVKNNPNYLIIFAISFLVGLFLGFWVVMFKHYLE